MEQNNEDEWYDGGDSDKDIDALNKEKNINQRNPASMNLQINSENIKPNESYNKLNKEYDPYNKLNVDNISNASTYIEENPITKFNRIKNEIDLIENDLKYYSEHKETFKGQVSLEKTKEELNKLKQLAEYVKNSDNYKTLEKINENVKKNNKTLNADQLAILNKKLYEKLSEKLLDRMNIINKLKSENPTDFNNVEYELYVSPDTEKIKNFNKICELKKTINSLEEKIGDWNYEKKKKSISMVLDSIKNNLRIYDAEFKKKIESKLNNITSKLDDIKKNDFYSSIENNKQKLEQLLSNVTNSKDVEDTIYNTISKMESLKNSHEESAFISLKIKELIDQQEKISVNIQENKNLLDNLKNNIVQNSEVMQNNLKILNEKLNKK
jgi:hypothetical protein